MAVEDYTTYTEVDPNNHINYVGTNHIDFDSYENEDCYAYKDFGTDYFTDFVHYVDVKVVGGTSGAAFNAYGWCLANNLNDISGQILSIYLRCSYNSTKTNKVLFGIRENYSGSTYYDNTGWNLTLGQMYYFRIEKNGTSLICDIYSTAELRNAGSGSDGDIDTLSLTLHADHSLRYCYSACNLHAIGAEFCETDHENLDLNPIVPTTKPSSSIVRLMEILGMI